MPVPKTGALPLGDAPKCESRRSSLERSRMEYYCNEFFAGHKVSSQVNDYDGMAGRTSISISGISAFTRSAMFVAISKAFALKSSTNRSKS